MNASKVESPAPALAVVPVLEPDLVVPDSAEPELAESEKGEPQEEDPRDVVSVLSSIREEQVNPDVVSVRSSDGKLSGDHDVGEATIVRTDDVISVASSARRSRGGGSSATTSSSSRRKVADARLRMMEAEAEAADAKATAMNLRAQVRQMELERAIDEASEFTGRESLGDVEDDSIVDGDIYQAGVGNEVKIEEQFEGPKFFDISKEKQEQERELWGRVFGRAARAREHALMPEPPKLFGNPLPTPAAAPEQYAPHERPMQQDMSELNAIAAERARAELQQAQDMRDMVEKQRMELREQERTLWAAAEGEKVRVRREVEMQGQRIRAEAESWKMARARELLEQANRAFNEQWNYASKMTAPPGLPASSSWAAPAEELRRKEHRAGEGQQTPQPQNSKIIHLKLETPVNKKATIDPEEHELIGSGRGPPHDLPPGRGGGGGGRQRDEGDERRAERGENRPGGQAAGAGILRHPAMTIRVPATESAVTADDGESSARERIARLRPTVRDRRRRTQCASLRGPRRCSSQSGGDWRVRRSAAAQESCPRRSHGS